MGVRVGGAGDVGVEDGEVVAGGAGLVQADEPDEARAEHGVCGGEEGGAEGVEGGEGGGDLGEEGGRDVRGRGGGGRGQGAEEDVVVVGGGSVVEEGGMGGLTGVFEEEGLGVDILVGGAWREL